MAPGKRVTMFLLREFKNGTTWGATSMAKDTEIRLADGTFALIQNSVGKSIWTDQQEERRITRIHKFDTEEADLCLFGIGGNWMTGTHFIWGQNNPQLGRACEIPGVQKTIKTPPKGSVYAVELSIDGHPDPLGGHPGSNLWKLPSSGTALSGLHTGLPL